MALTNRDLAESLFLRMHASKEEILKGACCRADDHELAKVIYNLLQDDKDSPVYPYVCLVCVYGLYKQKYKVKEYYEDAIHYFRQLEIPEEKITPIVQSLQRICCQIEVENVAERRIVHPAALPRIKGIETFNEEKLNLHDGWVQSIIHTEKDYNTTIILRIKPTWADNPIEIKLNNVIDISIYSGCNFIILYGVCFYIDNNFLICDMDGVGSISCSDAEILNVEEFIEGIPAHWKNDVIKTRQS